MEISAPHPGNAAVYIAPSKHEAYDTKSVSLGDGLGGGGVWVGRMALGEVCAGDGGAMGNVEQKRRDP